MKMCRNMSFSEKIRWRIKGLWSLFAGMLVYMVVVSELGGGDSRMMTRTAETVSRLIFFGGMIVVAWRLYGNYQLLKNRWLGHRWHLDEARIRELDERNRYLHDKSGGIVLDALLLILLFTTTTAALFNMPAFYLSLSVLLTTVVLKCGAYWLYSRGMAD